MDIKILGTGCCNCLRLEVLVLEVLDELRVRGATVEKVADERTMSYFLVGDSPPGLVINGELVSAGRVPSKSEISHWITKVTGEIEHE